MARTPSPFSVRHPTWRAILLGAAFAVSTLLTGQALGAEPADTEAPTEPSLTATIRRMLESGGTPAEKAARFSKALEKAAETEELAPMIPWLSDADDRLALTSAVVMIAISDAAEGRLIKVIKSSKKPRPPLIVALGASERKETIDFLVQRVAKLQNLEKEPEFAALQIRTGRVFRKGPEWTSWWKKERAKFKRQQVADFYEFFDRLRAVHMDKAFAKLEAANKETGLLAPLAPLFNSIARGRAMDFSEETLRAVAHFCRGELDEARDAYAEAVEIDQFDRVAFLDLACLQLEANQYEDAAESFRRLEVLIPNSPLIGALRKLAEEKIPSNEWLGPLGAALGFNSKETDILSDPLVEFLTSRSVSSARLSIPTSTFEEILADTGAPFEQQFGAALSVPRLAAPTWFAEIRARFPDSPVAHAWYFFATIDRKQFAKDNADACARWSELEPDNAIPRLATLALKIGKPKGDQPLPAYQGALLDELESALASPKTDFHLAEANAAVQRMISETKFPLPAKVSNPDDLIGGFISKVAAGMTFRSGKDFKIPPEQMETYRRTRDVFAKLAERLDREKFRTGMTQLMVTVPYLFTGHAERVLLRQEPGNEEAIGAISAIAKERSAKAEKSTSNPTIVLRLLPLPSLDRAILQAE